MTAPAYVQGFTIRNGRATFASLFGDGDGIAGLFSGLDLIDDARQFFEADNGQSSRQNGASDLVKPQVAHVLS